MQGNLTNLILKKNNNTFKFEVLLKKDTGCSKLNPLPTKVCCLLDAHLLAGQVGVCDLVHHYQSREEGQQQ